MFRMNVHPIEQLFVHRKRTMSMTMFLRSIHRLPLLGYIFQVSAQ
ncbi:hypothetical protein [Geobacillus sp. Y412MC52]|nr:hypothetical protein [Geobacillus sp. Y412MC52]